MFLWVTVVFDYVALFPKFVFSCVPLFSLAFICICFLILLKQMFIFLPDFWLEKSSDLSTSSSSDVCFLGRCNIMDVGGV